MQRSRTIGPALPSLPPKRSFVPFARTISTPCDQSQRARFTDQLVRCEALQRHGEDTGPASVATRSTSPSRSMISMFFSATAAAVGCPE